MPLHIGKKMKSQYLAYLIFNLVIFFIFNSRALLVASMFTFVLLTPLKFKKYYYFSFALIFLFLVIFYKHDSSLGRLFIYKVSSNLLIKSWPLGVGPGNFKRDYLVEQGKYFSDSNFSKSEFLLADNTVFAFNDWFQSICEHGVLAILIISLFIYVLLKIYSMRHNNFWIKYYLLSILIMAFFTHVFEREYIVNLVLLTFLYLFYEISLSQLYKRLIYNISFIVVIYAMFNQLQLMYQTHYLEKAIKESNIGRLRQSNEIFLSLLERKMCNEYCLFYYSRNCYMLNNYDESIKYLNILLSRNSNSLYYSLLADCLLSENKFSESEKYFIISINMVPNRFEERFKLLNLYLDTNQIEKAKEIANFIIDMPIKVPSNRIIYIKQFCAKII